jgi:hypothetical protein
MKLIIIWTSQGTKPNMQVDVKEAQHARKSLFLHMSKQFESAYDTRKMQLWSVAVEHKYATGYCRAKVCVAACGLCEVLTRSMRMLRRKARSEILSSDPSVLLLQPSPT